MSHSKPTVLIVEDEGYIRRVLEAVLHAGGYRVLSVQNGAAARAGISAYMPDLLLLDLGLPDMDGIALLKELRGWSRLPVIVVSARSTERDKILALDCGADDYITKPFNPLEVLARVKAQLRRYAQLGGMPEKSTALTLGGIAMDDERKSVTLDGEEVTLTPTEYDILRLLLENPGKVFSSADIYRRVWKDEPFSAEGTVPVHIRHLREKLEIDPANPRYLKVVWGKGYKLEEMKK